MAAHWFHRKGSDEGSQLDVFDDLADARSEIDEDALLAAMSASRRAVEAGPSFAEAYASRS